MENKFKKLSEINCNKFTEKKNGLTYLSWAHAWAEVKLVYPSANYEVIKFDGKPYLFDENLGYLVETRVTIDGETIPMQLPVMDGANKAQKHVQYTYEVAEWVDRKKTGNMIEKKVEPATMFDINTAIMRCMTKNLAMFGLGHYIYAGEDLPQVRLEPLTQKEIEIIKAKITASTNEDILKEIFNSDIRIKTNKELVALITKRKEELLP